mgnify:CR=1 FL=1
MQNQHDIYLCVYVELYEKNISEAIKNTPMHRASFTHLCHPQPSD